MHDAGHPSLPGRLEHRGGPGDIRNGVPDRVGKGGAYPGLAGKVDDDGVWSEPLAHGGDIQYVMLPEGKARSSTNLGQIAFFHGPGIKGVEVVHAYDLITLRQERFDQMRADEAGGARDQEPRHLRPRPIP